MELGSKERLLLNAIFSKKTNFKFIVNEEFLGIKSLQEIFTDIVLSEITVLKPR